jgi:acetone carboxylase alpha subunit
MIRELVEEVIRADGIEAYEQFAYEVIEEGRRGLMSRIKAMTLPGIYRKVSFVDVPSSTLTCRSLRLCQARLDHALALRDDDPARRQVEARLEGASRWGWHSFNAHQVAFTSGIWVMMCQTLVPTQRINDGAYFATEFRLPKGTWCNPDDRRTGHAYAWHFLVSGWAALWRGLSQSYFSRGYLEEVNAGNANTSNWLQGGGINQDGDPRGQQLRGLVLRHRRQRHPRRPQPRRRHLEPRGRHGDVEIWEMAEPLLYLGRNVKANSGGYGQYRGGCGFESLRMVWNAQD